MPALLALAALAPSGWMFARDEADIGRAQQEWEAAMAEPVTWERPLVIAAEAWHSGALKQHEDGILGGKAKPAASQGYVVRIRTRLPRITAVRVEFFFDPAIAGDKRATMPAMLSEFWMSAIAPGSGAYERVPPGVASTDYVRPGNRVEMAIDGNPATAWEIDPTAPGARAAVFELREPIEVREGSMLIVHLQQRRKDAPKFTRFRITVTSHRPPVRELPGLAREALALEPTERTDEQRRALRACFLKLEKSARGVRPTK